MRLVPTTPEVARALFEAHPGLKHFGSYTDSAAGIAETTWGFEFSISPVLKTRRDPKGKRYWLCIAERSDFE